ncbi:GAF domain-containing protein [Paenibacillus filicis]|uniref:GAF domain-containing protein n=1 Tax=Paenibacillus gyeongsangnamensis TaxID=3388067 RepID=A0ABT4QD88_9BACL|nr:GAF domain-containing protein [Paenibacillus filicis]MCZ8514783.1 GAF domain-containing protein [Paenibacillus filicis]
MDSFDSRLASELQRLRDETGSDLVAFAVPVSQLSQWRWVRVIGAESERILRLAVQTGRGIAGAALRTGRTIVLDRHKNANDLRKEDASLLLAERLSSVAAAPVIYDGNAVGLILIGSRSEKDYDNAAVQLLGDTSSRLAAVGTINR